MALGLSLSKRARKEEGAGYVWPGLRTVCLIQSSVTGCRAVLGSGQDGVLSDAAMSPYCVQDVARTVI